MTPWPDAVDLGGTDWFLYGIDRWMRKRDGAGCVCHMILRLRSPLGVDELERRADGWFAWLGSLRLRAMPPVVRPRWVVRGQGEPVQLIPADTVGAFEEALPGSLDPRRDACVRLATAALPDGTGVVALSWHHALLDAHGAEQLMISVGAELPVVPAWPAVAQVGLWARLKQARSARDFVWDVSVGAVVGPEVRGRRGALRHHHVVFGPEECQRIEVVAGQHGAGLFRSALHASACARAVSEVMAARGVRGDLMVPMPQDRRAGGPGPVGNGISLLFFRVPAAVQGEVGGLVRHTLGQLRTLAQRKVAAAMAVLLDLCRWLPSWLYMAVVSLPSRGRLASFGFSDTGDSLSRLERFAGHDVTEAWHLPANVHPPGLSFVFSRFGDRLQVCVARNEGVVSGAEVDRILQVMRGVLLGDVR